MTRSFRGASLPQLTLLGHDAIHVNDLPGGGRTSDSEITTYADAEERVVVTKDADFRHTHETGGRPQQLLYVSVGNVRNSDLLEHFEAHDATIAWRSSRPISSSLGAKRSRCIRGRAERTAAYCDRRACR